jgi:hypothetical protein
MLVFFEETKRRTDNLTRAAVAPSLDLPVDERLEMVAQGNACVLGHDD